MLKTIAYDVRSTRLPRFRRCGIDFTREPRRVEVGALSPLQIETLLASKKSELEVVEVLGSSFELEPVIAEEAVELVVEDLEPPPLPPVVALASPVEEAAPVPESLPAPPQDEESESEAFAASEEGEATPVERPARRRGRKKR